MKLPRFRLSGILIAFAVVVLPLGALQIRRQNLKRELAALTNNDCIVRFEDRWLWPTPPKAVGITFWYETKERVWHNGKAYTPEQAVERFFEMEAKLRDFGVSLVWMNRHGFERLDFSVP